MTRRRGGMTMWLALAFSVHALGCASMDGGGSYASSGDEAFASYVSPDGDTQHGGVQAGTLTAGVWDDNLNPELFEAYRQEVLQAASGALPDYSEAERAAALDHAAPAPRVTLEVALVVDATGSMGDELEYLKAELRSIAETVAETHPNATPRWALVAYRDEGDAYVTQRFDFAGLEAMHRHLRDQVAGGGGDYPEAADRALADAATLSWSTDDSTARLLFWVADAPHHDEDTQALEAAVRALRDQDVRIYPVAASGVGDTAEWTMRSAAQVTRGRYLFLTDDSGVGLSHAEPRVPCYFVTKLNTAMVRMIDIELGGSYLPPAADTLVRETGTIVDGVCFENQVPVATAY